MLYGAPDFEFSRNRKSLPSHDYVRDEQASRSSALRGGETNREAKIKKSRARAWITASLGFALFALLGYSFFHLQGAQNLPATPDPSVMNVSAVSNSLSQVPLRLSMQVFGQRKEADRSFTEIIVREGGTLRSGDQFQVQLKVNRSAYVYLLLYDSRGQASKLFPNPKIDPPGFLTEHSEIAIPDKHLWFWLDDHRGTETLYALGSAMPLKNISELLSRMESVQPGISKPRPFERQEPNKSIQRGVGGIAQAKVAKFGLADSSVIKRVTAVVLSSGAAVRALSFRHE
jgi:hypothetical protein